MRTVEQRGRRLGATGEAVGATRITIGLLALGLFAAGSGGAARAGLPVPAPRLSYAIQARVDPASRKLSGQLTLRWTNPSGTKTVSSVPLHLYLNAFSHSETTWMREVRAFAGFRFNQADLLRRYPDPWGYLRPTRIQQVGAGKASWRPIQPDDGNPLDRTLIEVRLPRPIPPGGTLELRVTFSGRLPVPIARTGCTPRFCLVGQWFPKLGVYQRDRWVARQFHGPTEFFADFADYDVTIDAPAGFVVGATGRRRALRPGQRGAPRGYTRVRYAQRWVHDFAVVLGRDLLDRTHRHRGVDVRYLLPAEAGAQLAQSRRAIEGALDCLGRRVGPYPYRSLTVVLPPHQALNTAGMEYPTLITGASGDALWRGFPLASARIAEQTLVHELTHQYFYGLLASNEQEEALLDEGLTSHWDGQCMREIYGRRASMGRLFGRAFDAPELYTINLARNSRRIRESVRRRPSSLFFPGTAFLHIYSRPALALWTASGLFGQKRMDRVFSSYLTRHRFSHPSTEDLLAAAAEAGGADVGAFLSEALDSRRVPDFRVAALWTQPLEAPLGRVPGAKGQAVVITSDNRWDHRALARVVPGLSPQGMVRTQITDPGWSRGGRSQRGAVRWVDLKRHGGTSSADKSIRHSSSVLIQGPAWDHLPAEVVLRFSDGAELREHWDSKAAWRGYRVVRGAPLSAVQIDRARKLMLDVRPQNNGRSVEADARFTADWGGWLGALVSWLAEGVSLWL
jgi:Peptidase family M1 domain